MKYKKFNDYVTVKRAHPSDAGLDIFVGKPVTIPACTTVTVPLGIGILIPYNFVGFLETRSSLAVAPFELSVAHCPIDPMYRGEIKAIITNNSGVDALIPANIAICQLVIYNFHTPELVPDEDWDEFIGKPRGTGGFGSTDRI